MAKNTIGQTINNFQQTNMAVGGSSTVGTNFSYTPTQIRTPYNDDSASKMLGSLMDFAKTGTVLIQEYDKQKKQDADERSNQILQSLSPEQRAAALKNGTLLYQDDPYTMNALKRKVAQNATVMADSQILDGINKGQFNSTKELDDYIYTQRAKAAKDAAELNGFDFNDSEFQYGFSSNADERNMKLQEGYAQWQSGQIQKTKALHDSASINGIVSVVPQSDPNISAQQLHGYIMTSGGSDDDKVNLLNQTMKNLSGVSGGAQVIQSLRGMDFNLYGQRTTIDGLYGKTGAEKMISDAGASNYSSDRAARDSFNDRLATGMSSNDPTVALQVYQDLSSELDRTQPGQFDTPQRQALANYKESIARKQAALAQQTQELTTKQAQKDNRADVLYQQYVHAAQGDTNAVTDFNAQTTNESSGNYTAEDSINAGSRYYEQVMGSKDLTPEQKSTAISNLSLNTPKDQGINVILKNKIGQANNELMSAALQGKLDFSKTPNTNNLIQLYRSNPAALANIMSTDPSYADSYATIASIVGFSDNGIDPTILLTGKQKIASMSDIQKNDLRTNGNKFITKTSTDSRFSGMGGLPMQIAGSIFNNVYASTGDIDTATNMARGFLVNNVTDISKGGDYTGQVLKSSLQVSSDVKSVEIGRGILQDKVNDLVTQYPGLKGKLTVSTDSDGSIIIQDPSTALKAYTGQPYIRISRYDLVSEYNERNKASYAKEQQAVTAEENRIRSNQGKYNPTKPTGNGNVTSMEDAYNQASTKKSKPSKLEEANNQLQGLTNPRGK